MWFLLTPAAVLGQPRVGKSFSSLPLMLILGRVADALTTFCLGYPLRGGLRSFPTLALHDYNTPPGYAVP